MSSLSTMFIRTCAHVGGGRGGYVQSQIVSSGFVINPSTLESSASALE